MTKQSGDADGLRRQTTGGIPQRGTAELSLYQDSQLKLDSLRHLQPVQLCQESRDAVVPRCRIH